MGMIIMSHSFLKKFFLTAAACACISQTVYAAPETLNINRKTSHYMDMQQTIKRIAVGNPGIATVIQLPGSASEFLIVTKDSPGSTALFVWTLDGMRHEYTIVVSEEDPGQAMLIEQAINLPDVHVKMVGKKILLTGTVENQYERNYALQTVRLYVDGGTDSSLLVGSGYDMTLETQESTSSSSDDLEASKSQSSGTIIDLLQIRNPTQIRLEAQIIEINSDNAKDLGLQYGTSGSGGIFSFGEDYTNHAHTTISDSYSANRSSSSDGSNSSSYNAGGSNTYSGSNSNSYSGSNTNSFSGSNTNSYSGNASNSYSGSNSNSTSGGNSTSFSNNTSRSSSSSTADSSDTGSDSSSNSSSHTASSGRNSSSANDTSNAYTNGNNNTYGTGYSNTYGTGYSNTYGTGYSNTYGTGYSNTYGADASNSNNFSRSGNDNFSINQTFGRIITSSWNDMVQFSNNPLKWITQHFAPVNATLNLLVTSGKAKVLSRPSVMTLSGEQATIQIGGKIPYTTTNSNGASNTQFEDYGIILQFKPVVDAQNRINSMIHAEVSNISGQAVNGQPIISTRRADSVINLSSGSPIVIGGLMDSSETKTVQKIPLLGDIPIIGEFFKHTSKSRDKRELIIIVTPYLVGADEVSQTPMSKPMREWYMQEYEYRRSMENFDLTKPYEEPEVVDEEKEESDNILPPSRHKKDADKSDKKSKRKAQEDDVVEISPDGTETSAPFDE